MRLYRIMRQTTNSLQPTTTCWRKEVLYCGYSRKKAIRIFHSNRPLDFKGGFGNPAAVTVAQSKEVKEDWTIKKIWRDYYDGDGAWS